MSPVAASFFNVSACKYFAQNLATALPKIMEQYSVVLIIFYDFIHFIKVLLKYHVPKFNKVATFKTIKIASQ